jgi:tRNA (guanine10-N2)-methyltransferase
MKFLAVFASSADLAPFRVRELLEVVKMTGADSALAPLPGDAADQNNFAIVHLPSEDVANAVASRCVLLRGLYVLHAAASSLESLANEWREHAPHGDATLLSDAASFKYSIESVGRKYSMEEKLHIIEQFASVWHRGSVSISHPDVEFTIFLEHATLPVAPRSVDSHDPPVPIRCFHTRLAHLSRRAELLSKYSLKRRPYIGTTSMPPEYTFLMANLAHVRRHDLVYDPFCGTGSSLISAVHWGAAVLGSDMNGRVLKSGTGKVSILMQQQQKVALESWSAEELKRLSAEDAQQPSMSSNFKIYHAWIGPERVRMNFCSWHQCFRHCLPGSRSPFLDAILSDPPYGLREQKKRTSDFSDTPSGALVDEGRTSPCVSLSHAEYDTSEMMLDLVMFAAEALVVGGRLCFWLPTTPEFTHDEIPVHPCMKLVHCEGQRVTLKLSRYLVTMEKVTECDGRIGRDSCCPLKRTENLRPLLDQHDIAGNADYAHYRVKLERKRRAAREYNASRGVEGAAPPLRLSKIQRQELQVANRAANLAQQQQKDAERCLTTEHSEGVE